MLNKSWKILNFVVIEINDSNDINLEKAPYNNKAIEWIISVINDTGAASANRKKEKLYQL